MGGGCGEREVVVMLVVVVVVVSERWMDGDGEREVDGWMNG